MDDLQFGVEFATHYVLTASSSSAPTKRCTTFGAKMYARKSMLYAIPWHARTSARVNHVGWAMVMKVLRGGSAGVSTPARFIDGRPASAGHGHVQEMHPLVLRFFEESMDPSAISALHR